MGIVSTYRLQFHKGFTFLDAAEIVPYLHDLGITHVYASPYLKAVAGSTHGYDVIDQSQLNPEVGSTAEYRQFVSTLTAHGMSHILDTVPNHMGVETNDNRWWNDVLTHGQESPFANYFDIDWNSFSPRRELIGKVLLPFLGETYSQALSQDLFKLVSENGKPFIDYRGRHFPIDPASNMDDDLALLLRKQHYRLCYWRVAADEINYRRFFDIAGLAALQMQRQEVFDTVHEFTFQLIAEGSVAGLRVDHPDGLLDPKEYFERLQAKYMASCQALAADGKPLFVSVEKILNGDEQLCEDWPVSGTSGYDFLYAVNDLFIDSANESAMTDVYTNFVGEQTGYADWVYREKCMVLGTSMYSEMNALTNRLDELAQLEVSSRDFTRRQLHDALREVIACFAVYRSYVSSRGVSESDVQVVNQAVDQAIARNPTMDPSTLNFIRETVLLRYPVGESVRGPQLDFAMRFQQLTSPVNAKGIEDSTFYIYNRLTSLNEVGGDPGRFGRGSNAIHRYFSHRCERWPLSISSLSTHDTKRSEDVRARINVLSEIPDEWASRLVRWREINASASAGVHPNDQYLLYQTLLGAWPMEAMDDEQRKSFVTRISSYMQKATREAKLRNSWVDPDQAYETAIDRLIKHLTEDEKFLGEFQPFQNRISKCGMINSLSQTVLRLTAPGICDTYQGTELWDFSLVDPDNRRPVDYRQRTNLLADLQSPATLVSNMEDGRIKLWVIRQLLHYRRESSELFLNGSYQPIKATGSKAAHIFAFARLLNGQCVIVIVPTLVASLMSKGQWGSEDWGDTRISLPSDDAADAFQNLMTGNRITIEKNAEMNIAQVLHDFPVAVLRRN